MFVAVARVTLQISEAKSLKDKRQVLRRVVERVKARFNASIAEVAENDVWQKAVVGISVVGNDRRHVNEQIDKILHFVEEMYVAPVTARELEIVGFGESMASMEDDSPGLSGDALRIPKGDRSLAEAEGIAWEDRHQFGDGDDAGDGVGDGEDGDGRAGRQTGELSLDQARARARALRNPREWEKK